MKYLDKRCRYSECNKFLPASQAKQESVRKKKDEKKEFCDVTCMAKHKKQQAGPMVDKFIYG